MSKKIQTIKVKFGTGQSLIVGVAEFGNDGIGLMLDELALKHGGVTEIEVPKRLTPPRYF